MDLSGGAERRVRLGWRRKQLSAVYVLLTIFVDLPAASSRTTYHAAFAPAPRPARLPWAGRAGRPKALRGVFVLTERTIRDTLLVLWLALGAAEPCSYPLRGRA